MQAENETVRLRLRDRYREGIPRRWGAEEQAAAARLYTLLAGLGGRDLVGDSPVIAEGVFWPGPALNLAPNLGP
jgi:NitT/TauT family transport system substrate-binding protein